MPDPTKKELETLRQLAARHSVCTRTIDRWSEDGTLPPPIRIKNRKYYPAGTVARRDDGPDA
jgi:hypothetical protein